MWGSGNQSGKEPMMETVVFWQKLCHNIIFIKIVSTEIDMVIT